LDLIQEWNTGLFKAVDKYDPEKFKDNTFYTYAWWWIRQRIKKAITEKSRTINLPPKIVILINRIKYTSLKLTQKLLREPELDEVAKELKMSVSELEKYLKFDDFTLSLNYQYGENDDTDLIDFVEDMNPSPEERVNSIKVKENIDKILKSLTSREEQVLRMRYWIDWWDRMSQAKVWEQFSISKQRVEQIENDALKKLRKNKKSLKLLKELLEK